MSSWAGVAMTYDAIGKPQQFSILLGFFTIRLLVSVHPVTYAQLQSGHIGQ